MKSKENASDKGLGGGHGFPRRAARWVAWRPCCVCLAASCWEAPAMPETAPSWSPGSSTDRSQRPFLVPILLKLSGAALLTMSAGLGPDPSSYL